MDLSFEGDGTYLETVVTKTENGALITIQPTEKLKKLLETLEGYFELIRKPNEQQ
jgi:hypothetical protein